MLKLLITEDGSHTVKNLELDETYHSIHGAIQESNLVYIKNGLEYVIKEVKPDEIKILEVGFGTGLNALLTAVNPATEKINIQYDAIEPHPLPFELTSQLNYPDQLNHSKGKSYLEALHMAPWEERTELTSNFTIHKHQADIQKTILEKDHYDVVYFDAFAPNKQPQLWDLDILASIVESIKTARIFVTYSAKGQLKRDLKSLGMTVESLAGPPGKAQVIRALKLNKHITFAN